MRRLQLVDEPRRSARRNFDEATVGAELLVDGEHVDLGQPLTI